MVFDDDNLRGKSNELGRNGGTSICIVKAMSFWLDEAFEKELISL